MRAHYKQCTCLPICENHAVKPPHPPSRAEEQLVRINQVFQDVLKSEETRALYNQLCHFRQVFVTTLNMDNKPASFQKHPNPTSGTAYLFLFLGGMT